MGEVSNSIHIPIIGKTFDVAPVCEIRDRVLETAAKPQVFDVRRATLHGSYELF